MSCDCEKQKANPGLAANTRNAAALWVSAGKVAGFVEGVRYVCTGFDRALDAAEPLLLSSRALLPSYRKEVLTALKNGIAQMLEVAKQKEVEQENLNKAAGAMVETIEKGTFPRGLAVRLLEGWRAFRR